MKRKCEETDCNNKAYTTTSWTPLMKTWVCRKHHYDLNYGIVGQYWKKNHGEIND